MDIKNSLILSMLLKNLEKEKNNFQAVDDERIDFGVVKVTIAEIINNSGKAHLVARDMLDEIKLRLGARLDTLIYMIKENPMTLQYASEQFKDNEDIVKLAVFGNSEAMQFASKRLKQSKELAIFLAKNYRLDALEYMHPWLKNDGELALKLVSENGFAYNYLSERLKNSKLLVGKALQTSPTLFFDLPEKYRGDLKLADIASERDFHCYKAVAKNIKDNKPLALKMIQHNFRLYPYLSKEMKKDKDIISQYKKEIEEIEKNAEYREMKIDIEAYLCANLFNTKLMFMKDKREVKNFIKEYSLDEDQEKSLLRLADEYIFENNR